MTDGSREHLKMTAGLDLGDKYSHLCLLDAESGEIVEESRLRTAPEVFRQRFDSIQKRLKIAIEVGIEPVPELRALRGAHQRLTDVTLTPASPNVLRDVRGDCLEIVAEFEPQDVREFGLRVRCSPGGEERTRIVYDRLEAVREGR